MRVLIIEDNPDIAANLGDYLEDHGHTVDFAGDGITGLHLAVVNDFDAIVLDLALPGMDGLEVCRKLRSEAGKDTPVLMLTARDRLEDKLAGFDTGGIIILPSLTSPEPSSAKLTCMPLPAVILIISSEPGVSPSKSTSAIGCGGWNEISFASAA